MKHNNFSFLVGEGTKAIFKHGFMSFAAVCITVACLVIVTSFGLITYNIGLIVDDLQKERTRSSSASTRATPRPRPRASAPVSI